jgi:precorrin-2 dehydrogenase/sirohydrochlorin ferrochelatase
MIPLFVDCSRRRIVIFGGGVVAVRKAAYFAARSEVLVVSRSFAKGFDVMPVERQELDVTGLPDKELAGIIEGAFLVIGALSDPAINNRIGRLCRERSIFFNNADGETGDVILPSVVNGDHYTIAISTNGGSPAMSRYLREYLEEELPSLDAMIGLQNRLRERLKSVKPGQAERKAILRKVLEDPEVWKELGDNPDQAWERIVKRYLHD